MHLPATVEEEVGLAMPPENDRTPDRVQQRVDPRVTRTRDDVLSATLRLVLEGDPASVTHTRLARLTGYSRATIYKHWPTRHDLLRDALSRIGEARHHTPVGDLRHDLVQEVLVYRREMRDHQLDTALLVLGQMVRTTPELVPVRDHLVERGERVLRELLAPHLGGADLEAAILMLFGAVLQSTLLRGSAPEDSDVEAAVDLVMRAVDP